MILHAPGQMARGVPARVNVAVHKEMGGAVGKKRSVVKDRRLAAAKRALFVAVRVIVAQLVTRAAHR